MDTVNTILVLDSNTLYGDNMVKKDVHTQTDNGSRSQLHLRSDLPAGTFFLRQMTPEEYKEFEGKKDIRVKKDDSTQTGDDEVVSGPRMKYICDAVDDITDAFYGPVADFIQDWDWDKYTSLRDAIVTLQSCMKYPRIGDSLDEVAEPPIKRLKLMESTLDKALEILHYTLGDFLSTCEDSDQMLDEHETAVDYLFNLKHMMVDASNASLKKVTETSTQTEPVAIKERKVCERCENPATASMSLGGYVTPFCEKCFLYLTKLGEMEKSKELKTVDTQTSSQFHGADHKPLVALEVRWSEFHTLLRSTFSSIKDQAELCAVVVLGLTPNSWVESKVCLEGMRLFPQHFVEELAHCAEKEYGAVYRMMKKTRTEVLIYSDSDTDESTEDEPPEDEKMTAKLKRKEQRHLESCASGCSMHSDCEDCGTKLSGDEAEPTSSEPTVFEVVKEPEYCPPSCIGNLSGFCAVHKVPNREPVRKTGETMVSTTYEKIAELYGNDYAYQKCINRHDPKVWTLTEELKWNELKNNTVDKENLKLVLSSMYGKEVKPTLPDFKPIDVLSDAVAGESAPYPIPKHLLVCTHCGQSSTTFSPCKFLQAHEFEKIRCPPSCSGFYSVTCRWHSKADPLGCRSCHKYSGPCSDSNSCKCVRMC